MNCKDVRKYISSLVDNEIDIDIKNEVVSHIEKCDDCKKIYEEEQLIKKLSSQIELQELPKDFESKLHNRLVKEVKVKDNKKIKFNTKKVVKLFNSNKKYLLIAAVFLFTVVLYNNNPLMIGNDYGSPGMKEAFVEESRGSVDSNEMMKNSVSATFTNAGGSKAEMMPESDLMMSEPEMPTPTVTTNNSEYQTGRIIIKNGNINLDILDFDKTVDDIKNFIGNHDGYVSNMNSNVRYIDDSGREFKYGYLEIKIISSSFDEFLKFAKELGRVNGTNFSSQDITNVYRDTVSNIENLKITQNRLRDILLKSTTVEETLQIERELTRIRGQIDQLEGNVKNWDRLSQYATINISLNEVEEIEITIKPIDTNILQKATEALMKTINSIRLFLENLFISIIAYSPFIFTTIILLIIVRNLYKKRGLK